MWNLTMSACTAAEVAVLVEQQVSLIQDPEVAKQIRALLVPPYGVDRPWDYGEPGQAHVCWTVLEHRPSNTGIAYCANGFADSWGLVFLEGPHMSMGMDSAWFAFLEDAFRESAAWVGENPSGYEVR